MNVERTGHFAGSGTIESACGAALLGRLGRELATVFVDSVDEPLPPKLKQLIEHLDASQGAGEGLGHAGAGSAPK